MYTTNTYS